VNRKTKTLVLLGTVLILAGAIGSVVVTVLAKGWAGDYIATAGAEADSAEIARYITIALYADTVGVLLAIAGVVLLLASLRRPAGQSQE
jgi:hypothetical protein